MLPFKHLMEGFKYRAPLEEAALTIPTAADPPEHVFEGRLELLGELRSELGEDASRPKFDFEFVQEGGYLVPVQRGLIIADNPTWNYILEPGRAWQEPGDEGYTRTSFPFALLSAAMQTDPGDRGMEVDARRRYNNAFWASRYTPADGFKCEFWVVLMQGLSGNVVAMMPNGVSYYYFSDNQEFTWDAALHEADKISPLCP